MRKNLERNPILRKQQSQRKRFPTLQQSNQFGSKTLDPKLEEKFKEASEDS